MSRPTTLGDLFTQEDAPCGDEPISPVEPTPAQLARERVLHDFESAFAMLTEGR